MKKYRRPIVLVFGTFDLLHAGHRSFLRQAKQCGSTLIVVVSRDVNAKRLKGSLPVQPEKARLAAVKNISCVSRAVLAQKDPRQRFSLIQRINPDVLALGYDQTHFTDHLTEELRSRGLHCRVVRLKPYRPEQYKTSIIREALPELMGHHVGYPIPAFPDLIGDGDGARGISHFGLFPPQ
jgi:FAD synthetase